MLHAQDSTMPQTKSPPEQQALLQKILTWAASKFGKLEDLKGDEPGQGGLLHPCAFFTKEFQGKEAVLVACWTGLLTRIQGAHFFTQ